MEINTNFDLLVQTLNNRMECLEKKHPGDFESIDIIKYEIYDVNHMSKYF